MGAGSLIDEFSIIKFMELGEEEAGFHIDPIILSSVLFGIGFIVLLVYITRSITPVSKFLYANARIQSRNNYIVDKRKMEELVSTKSINDLVNHLRDSEYIEELEKIPDKNNIRMFHQAIETGFLASVLDLKKMSPKNSEIVFDAYLMILEAKVLKTMFRAKTANEDIDESLIFSVGNITPIMLKHLTDAKTIADMSVVLSTTPYAKLFEKEYKNAEQFDIAIEGFVLNNLIKRAEKAKMYESKFIVDIIRKKIDHLNLLALLKFRIRNLPAEQQLELIVPNKSALSNRIKDLAAADSLKKFVEMCKNLDYQEALERSYAQYEKDGSMMHFEQNLLRHYKDSITGNDIAHTLGPYPLFSYLIKKEIEMRNLFIISSGIDSKFEIERIKGMII